MLQLTKKVLETFYYFTEVYFKLFREERKPETKFYSISHERQSEQTNNTQSFVRRIGPIVL